jgi:hypothetical protein
MERRVGLLFYRFAIIQVNNPEQLVKSTQKLENEIECVKYLIGFEFKSPKILGELLKFRFFLNFFFRVVQNRVPNSEILIGFGRVCPSVLLVGDI